MAVALAAGPGAAQEPHVPSLEDVARASALVERWVDEGRIPGAVLSVRQRGRVVFEASYGHARAYAYGRGQYTDPASDPPRSPPALDDPVPMTRGTVFDLASVTKVMATTTAVALLVERGALDLEAPLSRYLPDFRSGGKERITLEHLLTHRAGLAQWKPVYYHASDPEAAYDYLRALPLEWPVGAGRHYSDLGFMLLGVVVERVSGRTLDAFLRDELYAPLGLRVTGFRGGDASGEDVRHAATSHGNPFERRMVLDPEFGYRIEGDPAAWRGWRERTLVGEVNDGNAHHAFGGVAGHAGLFSTAEELHVLIGLWLSGGSARGGRYFSRAIAERFLAHTGDGQALGWQVPSYAPETAFGHTGFTGTFVLGERSSGLAVVLLTNRQHGGVDARTSYPDLGPLQEGVVRALTGGR